MSLPKWLRPAFTSHSKRPIRKNTRVERKLEQLEDRYAPATITGGTGPGGFEFANGASPLALWLDGGDPLASGTAPLNGATIATWEDKSGFNRDAPTMSGQQSPTFLAADSAVNNTGAVRFQVAGGPDFLATTYNFDNLGANFTIFAVSRYNGASHQRVITSNSHNWLIGHHSSATQGWYFEGGPYNRAPNDENSRIYSALAGPDADGVPGGSAVVDFWSNGTQLDSNSTPHPTSYKPGVLRLGGTASEISDANISEIIFIDRLLNDAERRIVQNALSAKYNLGIGSEDVYAGDTSGNGDYDRNVFGIGRFNASN